MVVFLRWLVGDMLSQIVLPIKSELVLAPIDADDRFSPRIRIKGLVAPHGMDARPPINIRLSKASAGKGPG